MNEVVGGKVVKENETGEAKKFRQEIDNQLIEHDGYGQRGRKIPVDVPKGAVFHKRVKNWKDCNYGGGKDQEYAYENYWGIIEPWDGTAKYYDSYD